eukprot:361250-Chlamydomonas_euryale.AAC.25
MYEVRTQRSARLRARASAMASIMVNNCDGRGSVASVQCGLGAWMHGQRLVPSNQCQCVCWWQYTAAHWLWQSVLCFKTC